MEEAAPVHGVSPACRVLAVSRAGVYRRRQRLQAPVPVRAASASVTVTKLPNAFALHTLTPCRIVDTRNANGPFGGPALNAGADRSFTLTGQCGIPAGAKTVSLNLTVTQPASEGFLSLYPGGTPFPGASTINYSAGQTRANNAIVPLGAAGDIVVTCGQGAGTVHMILDVNGYFQ